MKDLIPELDWRGLLQDVTPGFRERLAGSPVSGYVGFDPTAGSLQIGNLVPVMLLAHLQRAGGRPIILVGGGTGLIGDPSGKRSERPLLDTDTVRENAERQRAQLCAFLDFDDPETGAISRNNADWLTPLNLVAFLRDIGKHFTLSYMLQKESVRSRLDEGLSFTEFSYMLLQAYDFLHLYTEEGCELQMGGSDQWGNITAGVELIRRALGKPAHGLSAPLVTTASGRKFGKTEEGSVWLDPEMTSPYKFFQFWINADDKDIEQYLKVFTFKTRDEIRDLMKSHAGDPGKRIPHRALAGDLAARIHGREITGRVERASDLIFRKTDLGSADETVWEILRNELPAWNTPRTNFPMPVVDLLAASGICASKGEARRQIQQGGIYLNEHRVQPNLEVSDDHLIAGRYLWLRRGKKTDLIVTVVS